MTRASIGPALCFRTIVLLIVSTSAPTSTLAFQNREPGGAESMAFVSGHIHDETGGGVGDASLSLFGLSNGFERTALTARDGSFVFPFVLPGTYVLRVLCQGFAPVEIRDLEVRPHDRLVFTIRVEVASIAEHVNVIGQRVAIRNSPVGPLAVRGGTIEVVQIAGEVQRTIPLSSRRDWADVLRLTPGVVQSVDATGLAKFHWRGSDATSHVLQIDGADMGSAVEGESVYINLGPEAVESVAVNDATLDAASPIGWGTAVDVVTRSGSNRLAGVVAWRHQDRSWNAANTPGGTSASVALADVEVSGSGPIRMDRAWYFGAGRRAHRTIGISRTPEQIDLLEALVPAFRPFDDESRETSVFFKTTVRWSTAHQVSGFLQHDMRPEGANGALNAGSFATRRFGGSGATVRLASAWRDRLTTHVSIAFNDKSAQSVAAQRDRSSRPVHQGVLRSGGVLVGTGAVAILDNVVSSVERPRERLIVASDLAYHTQRGFGWHDVLAGVYLQPLVRERTIERFVNEGVTLDEQVLRNPFDPGAGTVSFHRKIAEDASIDIRSGDYATYLQDKWQLAAGLTVHAGVRVDVIQRTARGLEASGPSVGFVSGGPVNVPPRPTTVRLSGQLQRSVEIGPRLGLTFRVGRDDQHVVTVGWGRMHETGFSGGALAAVSSTATTDLYDTNLDGRFDTTVVTSPRMVPVTAGRLPDGSLHQPYANEWLVAHRWQSMSGFDVGARFARRAYKDRLGLIETNARYEDGRFVGYQNRGFGETFLLTNNIWNWPVVSAVELQVSRQSRRFRLLGIYGRQWRHIAGTWQPNDPAAALQPDAFPNNRGIGSLTGSQVAAVDANSLSGTNMTDGVQWRDHALAVSGTWLAPASISVASTLTLQTGPWSGPIVTRLPSPSAVHPATVVTNGRTVPNPLATTLRFANATRGEGQFALPALHAWHLRVGYGRQQGRSRVETALELLNLLNHSANELAEVGANQTFNPNFRRGRLRQPPRAAQLSIRFAF